MTHCMMEKENLILSAQTEDHAAISRLLAVCHADARRYARKHCHASDVDNTNQIAAADVAEITLTLGEPSKGLQNSASRFHI
ncbi:MULTISPECIES: hypothetical protein [Aeromonas]|uniref:hypothetical protein n=1 Tax=Aeromonas TaxID=642 RepID=UPI002B05863F|nr:hypothetical protein [Aeromonas jandaei]